MGPETARAAIDATWIVTTDRNGQRHYVLPTGQIIWNAGCTRLNWTVQYAPDRYGNVDYGMTSTLREAQVWGEMDAAERAAKVSA